MDRAGAAVVWLDLTGHIHRDEAGVYVSYCDQFDMMIAGESPEEAFANTLDAVDLYLRSAAADGSLPDLLKRLGRAPAASVGEIPVRARFKAEDRLEPLVRTQNFHAAHA